MVSQAWPSVLEAVKAKGRVAWLLIGNATVVSLNEGVLVLRFPRQGDVKGFQSSRYEDLLKQVLNGMFGINVVVRAVSGADTPPPARRPGSGPVPPAAPSGAAPSDPVPGANAASAGNATPAATMGSAASTVPPADPAASSGQVPTPSAAQGPGTAEPVSPPVPSTPPLGPAGNGSGGATRPFGITDLPPPPDDDYFDPDDEDNSAVSTATELTGMALIQRELGAQVIGEYED